MFLWILWVPCISRCSSCSASQRCARAIGLFGLGIIFPVPWIIGALLGPTQSAEAAGVR